MMKLKQAIAVSAVAIAVPFAASAATVTANGITINIYQQTNTGNSDNSADAILANLGSNFIGSVSYTGALNFATNTQNNDPADTATIDQWLKSGGGSYVERIGFEFDETRTISSPNIGDGTALTTWFEFLGFGQSFNFSVRHDDGFCFYEDGTQEVCSPDPTTAITTAGGQYNGGLFQLVYAATNGDPSILHVKGDGQLSAVPLPAGLPLLLAGIGGLALIRRKKT